MSNVVVLKNRFSVWNKLIGGLGIIGAVASPIAALLMFWMSRVILNLQAATKFDAVLMLGGVLLMLVAFFVQTAYVICVMMFGTRAIQYTQARGLTVRVKPWQFAVSWFVPIVSVFMPAIWLRNVARAVSGENLRVRLRQLAWFWITWVLVTGSIGIGVKQPQGQNDYATVAMDLVALASVMSFAIVPLMLGRKLFAELDADLRAL